MCQIGDGRCFRVRMGTSLILLNMVISGVCGIMGVVYSLQRMLGILEYGAVSLTTSTTSPISSKSGSGSESESSSNGCLKQLEHFTAKLIEFQIYAIGLCVVYALLDFSAATLIGKSDFETDIGNCRSPRTRKQIKERRRFHFWASLQFTTTLVFTAHQIFNLVTKVDSPLEAAGLVALILWKLGFFIIFAYKLFHLEKNQTDKDDDSSEFSNQRRQSKKEEQQQMTKFVKETLSKSKMDLTDEKQDELPSTSISTSTSTSISTSVLTPSRQSTPVSIPVEPPTIPSTSASTFQNPPPPPKVTGTGKLVKVTTKINSHHTRMDSVSISMPPRSDISIELESENSKKVDTVSEQSQKISKEMTQSTEVTSSLLSTSASNKPEPEVTLAKHEELEVNAPIPALASVLDKPLVKTDSNTSTNQAKTETETETKTGAQNSISFTTLPPESQVQKQQDKISESTPSPAPVSDPSFKTDEIEKENVKAIETFGEPTSIMTPTPEPEIGSVVQVQQQQETYPVLPETKVETDSIREIRTDNKNGTPTATSPTAEIPESPMEKENLLDDDKNDNEAMNVPREEINQDSTIKTKSATDGTDDNGNGNLDSESSDDVNNPPVFSGFKETDDYTAGQCNNKSISSVVDGPKFPISVP